MDLYEYDEYKQALRTAMKERQKQFGSRFTYEKMATACGVQKTYLSKVLNSHAHLNPDQLFSACDFLKLSKSEASFLLLLREFESSSNSKRAKILKSEILKIRQENLKTESAIEFESEEAIEAQKWEYYTDTDLQLVHMFMTISTYSKEPTLICNKIGIDENRLQSILLRLQLWKIIQFQEGIYQVQDPKLHLSENSPVFLAFGILNRIKTIEKLRSKSTKNKDDYFFSATFSASETVQLKFKRKFLDLIKILQKEVVESKSEEVYQLNIDLFKWS